MSDFEYLAEWKVRRIPDPPKEPRDTYDQRLKSWVLSSIGVEGPAQDIYLYLENVDIATIEDLERHTGRDIETISDYVDLLYTTGLIDRMGQAYFVREALSTSIVRKLIPRITENLRTVAKMESSSRSDADYYLRMKGRSYSNVDEALVACREISRLGGTPIARITGTHGYTEESVEVEGPVVHHEPHSLVILSESGEKVVVGNLHARGVDVRAHSIVVRGEKNE